MNMFFPDKSRKIKLVTYLMFGKKSKQKQQQQKNTETNVNLNFCELVSKRVVLGHRNFLLNFR